MKMAFHKQSTTTTYTANGRAIKSRELTGNRKPRTSQDKNCEKNMGRFGNQR